MKKIDTKETIKKINKYYHALKITEKYTKFTLSACDKVSGGKLAPVYYRIEDKYAELVGNKMEGHVGKLERLLDRNRHAVFWESTVTKIDTTMEKLGAGKIEAALHKTMDTIMNPFEKASLKINKAVKDIPKTVKSIEVKTKELIKKPKKHTA